jgi:hypothetical protein
MTFAPGKVQSLDLNGIAWHRDLDMDLDRLKKEYNVYALISLLTDKEYPISIFVYFINNTSILNVLYFSIV